MAVVADVALALATAYAYVDGHGGQDGREGLVWWGGGISASTVLCVFTASLFLFASRIRLLEVLGFSSDMCWIPSLLL